jgi:hypothetical protein
VRRAAGLLGNEVEVEVVDCGHVRDLVGRLLGNDADLGLGPGQGGDDVQPGLEPGPLVEDVPQLVGAPQVGVEPGVG